MSYLHLQPDLIQKPGTNISFEANGFESINTDHIERIFQDKNQYACIQLVSGMVLTFKRLSVRQLLHQMRIVPKIITRNEVDEEPQPE